MHTVLARKLRPKKFADLIGQQNSVTILGNILNSNRLHHAYLLTGTRGVGKTTIARIIAKALNCNHVTASEPCCVCDTCVAIDKGNFIDVIEIDAASNTGVDNIRELIENAKYAPTSGKYKVYIIDEVHMLSRSAFNALLKTLEEPPEHVVFILATTDVAKVPITVVSRCLQLKLRNLFTHEIAGYLEQVLRDEGIEFMPNAVTLIATAAGGSMRDALSLLDGAIAFSSPVITEVAVEQMLGLTADEELYKILDALSNLDVPALLTIIERIYLSGADLSQVLTNLQHKLCAISIAALSKQAADSLIERYVSILDINDVQLYFEIAGLGIKQLAAVNDKYPVFVMTMLRMIAFNLGDNAQKSARITSVAGTETKATTAAVSSAATTPLVVTTERLDTTNTTPSVAKYQFNGDWHQLILDLKSQLGATLYPFMENATLESYNLHEWHIIVDKRYQSALHESLVAELNKILSMHLGQNITVKISFADIVPGTIKEHKLQQQDAKQQAAEQALHNDEYLLALREKFSATISPGSIKPT